MPADAFPCRLHRADVSRRNFLWELGGGIKGGTSYGTSDALGFKAEENPTYCYDLHATALHLLGIDHRELSVYNNGIQRRLTDVHGHVIEPILS